MRERFDALELCGEDVLLVILDERCVEQAIGQVACRARAGGGNLHVFACYRSGCSWLNPTAELAGGAAVGDPETVVTARIAKCLETAGLTARLAWTTDWGAFLRGVSAILGEGGCGEVLVAGGDRSRRARGRAAQIAELACRYCTVRVLRPDEPLRFDPRTREERYARAGRP